MNWFKVFLFAIGGPVVATLNNVLVSNATGNHIPVTAGTVLLPGLIAALHGLSGLFTTPPNASGATKL